MKILIVCSFNAGKISPFVQDQVDEIKALSVVVDYFLIQGSGILGYLSNLSKFFKKIKDFDPDIIHAHFGLSGLFACLQLKKPVVITFHGSDINDAYVRPFSWLASRFSTANIFVSNNLKTKLNAPCSHVIPCGVDLKIFKPIDKFISRSKLGLSSDEKLILFASSFSRKVKNPDLAINAVDRLIGVRLIELKNFSREEVAFLMNAVDVCLLTSFSEGSPQFIKESICCNAIVVSTNVGDLNEYANDLPGFYFIDNDLDSCINALNNVFISGPINFDPKSRDEIRKRFDNSLIAKKVLDVYQMVI